MRSDADLEERAGPQEAGRSADDPHRRNPSHLLGG